MKDKSGRIALQQDLSMGWMGSAAMPDHATGGFDLDRVLRAKLADQG
ncbi:MAG: hypothetical protein HRU31_01150 [Rhodobacteraceae bacterium]|nr:hypothetical protein [Paracoccaceae bacterium]